MIIPGFLQRRFARRLSGQTTNYDTGHAPMLTQPTELTDAITKVLQTRIEWLSLKDSGWCGYSSPRCS